MLRRYEIDIKEYDQHAVRTPSARIHHIIPTRSFDVSFFRIAKLMFMSGIASDPSSVRLSLEVTANMLNLLSKLAVRERYLSLSIGCKDRYRDYKAGFYAGEMGEALSWAFIQDVLQGDPGSICDLKKFILEKGIIIPQNAVISDYCFNSNNLLHILEAKGSWADSISHRLKGQLREGLLQNDSAANVLQQTYPVQKTHVTGLWLAESGEGWNSTLHYVDPEETGKVLNEDDVRFLKNQYYSGWFAFIGLFDLAKKLNTSQKIKMEEFREIFDEEDSNYYIFELVKSHWRYHPYYSHRGVFASPITELLWEYQSDRHCKIGIHKNVVNYLIGKISLKELGSVSKEDNKKFEVDADGTMIQF